MRTGTDSTEGRQRETGKSSVAPFISTRELILSFATRKNGGGDRGGGVCVGGEMAPWLSALAVPQRPWAQILASTQQLTILTPVVEDVFIYPC